MLMNQPGLHDMRFPESPGWNIVYDEKVLLAGFSGKGCGGKEWF